MDNGGKVTVHLPPYTGYSERDRRDCRLEATSIVQPNYNFDHYE